MVVLGVDPHKQTHTVVAADEVGKQLSTITIKNTPAGRLRLLRWAAAHFPERRWAVEDGRHVAGRLLRDLVAAGEPVTCVPTKLMASARAGARTRGKSDPIDALAVARAALREPDLPTAHLDDQALDLRLLVDHREHLVAERTRHINRLRWHLVDLNPELEPPTRTLTRTRRLVQLIADLEELPDGVRRDLAIDTAQRVLEDTTRITDLEHQITDTVTPLAPGLLAIVGISGLTAAKLIGEVAGIERFATAAKLANHAGTACIPVWSGNHDRHRLNRGANRQLNCAVHRVAITQVQHHPGAAALYARRRTTGDTKMGAYRVVKRHLIDVIFKAMKADTNAHLEAHRPPLTQAA
jgi:transposase